MGGSLHEGVTFVLQCDTPGLGLLLEVEGIKHYFYHRDPLARLAFLAGTCQNLVNVNAAGLCVGVDASLSPLAVCAKISDTQCCCDGENFKRDALPLRPRCPTTVQQ